MSNSERKRGWGRPPMKEAVQTALADSISSDDSLKIVQYPTLLPLWSKQSLMVMSKMGGVSAAELVREALLDLFAKYLRGEGRHEIPMDMVEPTLKKHGIIAPGE